MIEGTFEEPALLIQLHPLLEQLLLLAPCVGGVSYEGIVADISGWNIKLHIAVAKFICDEADDGMVVRC